MMLVKRVKYHQLTCEQPIHLAKWSLSCKWNRAAGTGSLALPGARAAHWFTHNSHSWLRHPIHFHYISSWTIGPIRKIEIINVPAVILLLQVQAELCWPWVQMSSLKHDNIKLPGCHRRNSSDGTTASFQVSPPEGEPGLKHVNVIIQMTEVTFNIGIIMLWVSHLHNL